MENQELLKMIKFWFNLDFSVIGNRRSAIEFLKNYADFRIKFDPKIEIFANIESLEAVVGKDPGGVKLSAKNKDTVQLRNGFFKFEGKNPENFEIRDEKVYIFSPNNIHNGIIKAIVDITQKITAQYHKISVALLECYLYEGTLIQDKLNIVQKEINVLNSILKDKCDKEPKISLEGTFIERALKIHRDEVFSEFWMRKKLNDLYSSLINQSIKKKYECVINYGESGSDEYIQYIYMEAEGYINDLLERHRREINNINDSKTIERLGECHTELVYSEDVTFVCINIFTLSSLEKYGAMAYRKFKAEARKQFPDEPAVHKEHEATLINANLPGGLRLNNKSSANILPFRGT